VAIKGKAQWKKKANIHERDAIFRSLVEGEVFFLLDFELLFFLDGFGA